MKKILQPLLLVVAMLCAVLAQAQSTVTIGTGTFTQRQPLGSYWGYERSAAIYHSSDIGRDGVIEKLSWYTGLSNYGYGIRIYLKHVTANNFPSTSNWATITSGAKLVYSDTNWSISSGQWKEFALTDTFNYYDSENLLVLVETNTGGYGNGNGSSTGTARYTTTTSYTNTHQYWTNDVTPPTGNGTNSSNRPNLRIGFVPDPIPDLTIDQVLSSTIAGCNVNTYGLQFRIKNIGGAAMSSGDYIRVGYTLNSGSEMIDSFQLSSALAINGTVDHTINVSGLSGTAALAFKFWSNIDADNSKLNDSSNINVINPVCVNVNSTEDFENGDGGWTSSSLWVRGAISKGVLVNPPSGSNAFITGLSGNYPSYANANLVSPFFDFTTSCNPTFSWTMRFRTEADYDGMIVEASSDGGTTWNKVTGITPGYNNTSGSGPVGPPKFSGNNNSWTTYTADLSAYSGMAAIKVRFHFGSDISGQDDGFAIDDAKFELYPTYTGSFVAPDSMFVNSMYDTEIENTSPSQVGINYRWVLDGTIIGSSRDLDYAFPSTGSHTLTLRCVDPCNAVLDSIVKTVIIINPSAKPNADFVADKYTVPQFGTVIMTNLSDNGPTAYEWYTTPSIYVDPVTQQQLPAVSYDNGTSAYSKNPEMSFIATGKFEICLIAENAVGKDTLCKVDYIEVGGGTSGPISYGTDSLVCVGNGVDASLKPSGSVFDPGGPSGNYPTNRNCDFIIDFKCYDSLVLNLDMIDMETGYDYLRIYDGPDASGTPLWDINSFPNGLSGTTAQAIQTAKSGKVTVQFESDVSITYNGFALSYQAMNYQSSITADFDIPDTICATYLYTFNNTTVGGRSFEWDFFGNGSTNSTQRNPSFTFANGGSYNVRLIAEGCSGIDTVIKTIYVSNPGQNVVAFSSPHTTYTTNDVVKFYNETNGCVEDYLWRIEPNRVTYLNGSQLNPMAEVMFDTAGVYTVTLFTTNSAGTDSLIKTSYITINDICSPKVDNAIADMGISRVVFGSIDNSSNADMNYTDYTEVSSNTMKGELYEVKVYRQSTANEVNKRVWIDYNADGDFDDVGELVASSTADRAPLFTEMIRIPRNAADGKVTMRVSTSYGTQANNPCGTRAYGETEDYRLVLYTDAIDPVITLNGLDTVIINRLDSYNDMGATAMDNLDGNISSFILVSSTLDSSIAGTYQVDYQVTDTAGNTGFAKRTIIVLPDAPTITLNGLPSDTIEVFTSFNDPTADAFDFNTNVLIVTADYSNVDTSKVGTYTIVYTATDVNGRSSSVTRNLAVVDRTAPMATLIGSDTLTVEVFDNYTEQGLNITDNYCPAGNFFTPSVIDWNTIGYKTLTYTVEDCYGNTSTIDRVIHIVDTKNPEIHLTGSLSANVIRLREYNDNGYTVSDNYNSVSELTIDTITTLVNTYDVGLYTLQYRATDASGNTATSEIRFIYVIDNVGIDQVKTLKLEVYPNPNRGQFSVAMDEFSGEDVIIRVSDMSGNLVHNENVNNFSGNASLNLENAAPGMYLVHVIQGSQQAVAKIVINK